ncbi:hypothetical protein [Bacillus sp. 3255]|uniref:hypothetical protein n=1 Tax=Bacillus sp. 3255 TaxID=2817904 RepID=UPI00286BB4A1|nr:hypothetical protein [Bacillus sp. 3255]
MRHTPRTSASSRKTSQEDKSGVKTTGFLFSPPKESKKGVIYAPTGPGLCMDVATLNGLLRKALQV